MKNVAVTGANSGIGKYLIRKLLQEKDVKFLVNFYHHNSPSKPNFEIENNKLIYNYEGDHLSDTRVYDILHNFNVDTIFHLAAKSTNNYDQSNIFDSNVLLTKNLIKYCPQGVRFVFASSIAVYGNGQMPFNEKDFCRPTSYYGLSKAICEQLINFATSQDFIRGVNLRLCANVGKGFAHGLLPDLIKKAQDDIPTMELITNSIKPFMFASDTANTLIKFGQSDHIGSYNVVPEDSIFVNDIAYRVLDRLDKYKTIKWNSEKTLIGDNQIIMVNNTKIKQTGLFQDKLTSSQAIDKAIDDILGEQNG